MSVARRSIWLAVAALLAACGGKDSTKVVTPASITAGASASGLTATVGTTLTTAPTFIVKDAAGNVLSGVPVTVTVASGGGTITGAPTTTTSGETSVGTWKLGNIAGTNTLSVTVGSVAPLIISATGTPGAASSIAVLSGNNQSGLGGTLVPTAIRFKVSDQFGNGVPSTPVVFSISGGNGFLSGSPNVTTGSDGSATAPFWTLGRRAEPQALRAVVGAAAATASATIITSYNVDIRQYGPATLPSISDAVTAAFTNAATRISAEIIGGARQTVLNSFNIQTCGPGGVLNETISSIVIFWQVVPIDGAGNILGSAGPCFLRSDGSNMPVLAQMRFDEADIAGMITNGSLNDVILHEMHHALGFGTIWSLTSPPVRVRAGTALSAFTGGNAITACKALGGLSTACDSIPLETTGGAGTADAHWKETTFRSELMTGFISGTVRPLSTISVASMQDLGYQVNMNVADAYVVGQLLRTPFSPGSGILDITSMPLMEEILKPIGYVPAVGAPSRARVP
jgi:hypothetical protein